ncbi:MAG TPA: sporulation integral membrane protein YtvI [Mobilitalea sp.]|nr:sporulation integral membrane protein YtvI [Mobilitalea sp.]
MKYTKLITYIKIFLNYIFIILVALFLLFVLPKLIGFFLPFVIGLVVAMIANPLVHFLEKKVKLLRKHSSAIIIVLVIVVIVGAAALLIAVLVREIKGLMNNLPAMIYTAKQQINDATLYINKLTAPLPDNIKTAIDNAITGIEDSITEYVNNKQPLTMSKAGSFVGNVAEGFLGVIVTILSAYFFAAGRDELVGGLKRILPDSAINYWRLIYDNFKAAFGGYFKAQFKIMLVLTVIMFIGFEILKVNYSFLFALGIAFIDLLPVFGTGAILWPWAIIDMINGNYVEAIGLAVIYLICQIVKQVLQPKMVGDSIGLHPLATLIFMFIGYKLYGVFGMIIGIPIGMVLVNLYRIGMFDRLIKGFQIIAHDLNEFRKF